MTHETLENNQSHSTISRLGRPQGSPNRPKPVYEADGGTAGAELRQFVERIERLQEERKAIGDDIKDVYLESKGRGFDVRAIRQIIRIRKQDHSERQEQEAILELYMRELGMVA